jgi:hypothetical protein
MMLIYKRKFWTASA